MMKRSLRILRRILINVFIGTIGFIVGAVAIYILVVRSGPTLDLWHLQPLKEEFTVDKSKTVKTFTDYLALEQRLFTELDEKIYAHTETGPEFELARFSGGSAADPRGGTPNWNRSFELPAESPVGGVLLLHGMSDSPYSLLRLGRRLNEEGYVVVGLRLPGHGTAPSGLSTITWEDMSAAVRLAMAHLAAKVNPDAIHIIGYSNGAPLAVEYALEVLTGDAAPAPASLILISPAIGVTPAAALAKWKRRVSRIPGLGQLGWTEIRPEFDPYKYNSFAINAGDQVFRLTRRVATTVETLAADGPITDFPPTLAFMSTVDATVSVDAVIDNLFEHLAPGLDELMLFDLNRSDVSSSIIVSDPGPFTARLMADDALPFHLRLIKNENSTTGDLVLLCKEPRSSEVTIEPLGRKWPSGIMSLSHIALPISPEDPLYGARAHAPGDALHLGEMNVRGERGLIKFPATWLLRLRHNPFYDLLEERVVERVNEIDALDS